MDNHIFKVNIEMKEAIKRLLNEDLEVTKKGELKKSQILRLKKRMDLVLYENYKVEDVYYFENTKDIIQVVFDWSQMDFKRGSDYENVYDFANHYRLDKLRPLMIDLYESTHVLPWITEY